MRVSKAKPPPWVGMKSLLVQLVAGTWYCRLHSRAPQELNLYSLNVFRKNTAQPASAVGTIRKEDPASASWMERIKVSPETPEENSMTTRKNMKMLFMMCGSYDKSLMVKLICPGRINHIKITDSPVQ